MALDNAHKLKQYPAGEVRSVKFPDDVTRHFRELKVGSPLSIALALRWVAAAACWASWPAGCPGPAAGERGREIVWDAM